MNLHTLTNTPGAKRPKRRVGRGMGSGLGKTCGRGHKGQYARTGHKHKPGFEGGQMRLLRRLPKRGFVRTRRHAWVAVNVGVLERFDPGTLVTAEVLRAAGLKIGPRTAVKILGGGNLTRKLSVRAQAFSAAAKTKIEACGGSWEVAAR